MHGPRREREEQRCVEVVDVVRGQDGRAGVRNVAETLDLDEPLLMVVPTAPIDPDDCGF